MMMHKKKAYILVNKTKVLKYMRLSAHSCQDHKECMCHEQLLIHSGFAWEVKKSRFLFQRRESPSVYIHIIGCQCCSTAGFIQREAKIAPLLFN